MGNGDKRMQRGAKVAQNKNWLKIFSFLPELEVPAGKDFQSKMGSDILDLRIGSS